MKTPEQAQRFARRRQHNRRNGVLFSAMLSCCFAFGSSALANSALWVLDPKSCKPPEYPKSSQELEEKGTVMLRALVGENGKVIDIEVEKSSGFRKLDEAARRGISLCTFKLVNPAEKPKQAWTPVSYTFKLD